ncbi:MAG: ribose-phosphate pyrophosphokinase [Lachnospiraceae bacterium]|nr:ribose-phosphate pyrophosphokinase [Lachnospiraceae bacterium]
MAEHIDIEDIRPVAPLGLIVHQSCRDLGNAVDKRIAEFRKHENVKNRDTSVFFEYEKDSYIIDCEWPRFGTGEGKAILHDTARGKDIFIITDVCNHSISFTVNGFVHYMSPDDIYMDLKRIIAAIGGKAHRITVVMPFLYESRQHKRTFRESLDCAMALAELADMGVNDVITFDAHDPKVQNSTPLCGFDNFTPPYEFISSLIHYERDLIIDKDHLIVISPDEGALDRAVYFAGVLGVNTGMFYKRRDYTKVINGKNPIVAHEFLGDNIDGKDVIIIDDMISSGGSMIDTAKQLKAMNAKRVYICCTFGLFTEGIEQFDKAYDSCVFEKIICTNLAYHDPVINSRPYFIEADMSDFLATVIDYMNHDIAMSKVHTNTEKIQEVLTRYNKRLETEFLADDNA